MEVGQLRIGVRGRIVMILFALASAIALSMVPLLAFADDEVSTAIKVDNVNASPGDTVTVAARIQNNPGILGAVLTVSYDNGLTLQSASNGDAFSALSMTKPGAFTSPCKFSWDGIEISSEDVRDGTILVLSFKVDEKAEPGAQYAVNVTGDAGDVFDSDLNAIAVTYAAGSITVADFLPGDLDGDKAVNSRDVIYARRHLTGGYQQNINVAAADVNNDLRVNSADVILLRRYIAGGYGVELQKSGLASDSNGSTGTGSETSHTHSMEAVAAVSPTCTQDGNIAYWKCESCGKFFSDEKGLSPIQQADTVVSATGHTPVTDAAVAPTASKTGLTAGSHCSVCGEVIQKQEVVPALDVNEYSITYDITNGDPYLASVPISNKNPTSYVEGDSFKLSNLSVPGYRFLGWYDGAGDDSAKVTRIDATSADDLELYAHWQVIPYTVQFESDLPIDVTTANYTVNKGLTLPMPKLSNYVFAGWIDEEGKLYDKRISVGSTGNLILAANWTSERNKTYTKPKLDDPIIVEDEESKTMLFAYEIGRIENVPVNEVFNFGYINEDIHRMCKTREKGCTSCSTSSSSTISTAAKTP